MRIARWLSIALLLCLLQAPSGALAEAHSQGTLNVYFQPAGNMLSDLPLINQKLNAYLEGKFDWSVQLMLPNRNNYHQAIQADLTLRKQIDIAFCNSSDYLEQWVENGWLLPLDTLLRSDGQSIAEWIADPYMYRSRGLIYGVGNNVDRGRSLGFEYDLDLAEKCQIDMSAVHSVRDLTQVFAQVAERCPDVVPTVIHPGYYQPMDRIGNNPYGVLMRPEDLTIVNLFETDWYWEHLSLIYQWTQQGYTYDRFMDSNSLLYYMSSGKIFGALCTGKPGFAAQETFLTGRRIGYIELVPYTLYSNAVNRSYCYVIPQTSIQPQAAMRLLNLLYTDPYIANLLIYGVEDLHYQKTSESAVRRSADSHYSGINGYTYCNQYIAYTFDGAPENLWQEMIQADATAPRTSAYGFLFDPTSVHRQIVRCDSVYNQYVDLLFSGQVDPLELREDFLSELRSAGIEEIIREKQRQFDLYLQAKGQP